MVSAAYHRNHGHQWWAAGRALRACAHAQLSFNTWGIADYLHVAEGPTASPESVHRNHHNAKVTRLTQPRHKYDHNEPEGLTHVQIEVSAMHLNFT